MSTPTKTQTLTLTPLYVFSPEINETPYMGTRDADKIALFMEKHNLSREDVQEYADYFLYDVVISNWVSGGSSKFDKDNLGKFELVNDLISVG